MPTIPRLHAATEPIERKPIPWTPQRQRYRNPSLNKGRNNTSAWTATPSVHVPAVSMILSVVQKLSGCLSALPNITMNSVNPAQLTIFAATELHAYMPKWFFAARIWPSTVYRP